MSSDLPPYLEFIPQCLVILCHDHGRCFTRRGIVVHLEQDHNTSSEANDRVHKAACELNVVKGKPNARQSASIVAPIPGLEIFAGYQCAYDHNCGWLTRDKSIFRQHLGAEHGLYGSDREDSSGAFNNVLLQNLFGNPKHPIYITVSPREPNLCEASIQIPAKGRTRDEKSADQPRAAIEIGDEAVFDDTTTIIPCSSRTDTRNASLPCESPHPQAEASPISQNMRRVWKFLPTFTPRRLITMAQQFEQGPGGHPSQSPHQSINTSPFPPPVQSATDSMEETSLAESTPACAPSFAQMVFRTEQKDTDSMEETSLAESTPACAPSFAQMVFRTEQKDTDSMEETSLAESTPACAPSFAQMVFRTEQKDTERIHLCLASDLVVVDPGILDPSPLDVDFEEYCQILRKDRIINSDSELYFVHASDGKVQITSQVTFRTAIICQIAQKVEYITFSSEFRTKAQLPSVMQISSESLNPLSQDSGPVFANTIFYAEHQGTDNTHLCLASDLSPPGSDKMNISPRLVDFEIYRELLKEEDVLNKDSHLGFIDAKGKRIPIKNQMMFHAAVMYQVTQKADMITFSSESIKRAVPSSAEVTSFGQASHFDKDRQASPAQAHSCLAPKTPAINDIANEAPNQPSAKSNFLGADQANAQRVLLESSLYFAKLPPSPHTTSPKATPFDRPRAELTPQIHRLSSDTFLQEAIPHIESSESFSLPLVNPRKRARDNDGRVPDIKSARLDIAQQIQPSSCPVSIMPIAASVVDGLLKIKYYQPPRDPNFWETNHAQPRRASKIFETFPNLERLIRKPHQPSPGPSSGSNREMSNTHSHPLSLVATSEEVVDHPIVKQEDSEHHESSTSNNFGAWYHKCGNYLPQPDHPQTYF